MISYEKLPEDIKAIYSKEQCEAFIKLADRLSIIVGDFIESIRLIIPSMQPVFKEVTERISSYIRELEKVKVENRFNIKFKSLPYKPKIKRIIIYKKPVYHHIRNNC